MLKTTIHIGMALALALLSCLHEIHGSVVINEFLANNDGLYHDRDGESPAWIELMNYSTNDINLAGWSLSDSPSSTTKWTFPSTNLASMGYLVVFASGKNRTVPGAELHTNFRLNDQGEYLGLFRPDGTMAHEHTRYPKQQANYSFGIWKETQFTSIIGPNSSTRYWVATNGVLGSSWISASFDDLFWPTGTTAIGFSPIENSTNILSLDIDERNVAPSTFPGFNSFVITSNSSATAVQTSPTTRTLGGITVMIGNNPVTESYDDRDRSAVVNNGGFNQALLLRDFIFSRSLTTGGLDIAIANLSPNTTYQVNLWSYDISSTGKRVSDWHANGQLVKQAYTFDGAMLPSDNSTYQINFNATSTSDGKIQIQGRRNAASVDSAGAASFGVFLNAIQISKTGFGNVVGTNVGSLMTNRASGLFVRLPFSVSSPDAYESLRLTMRYNDGFAAYINGQLVAARNAPASPGWDSIAQSKRTVSDTLTPEDIIIPVTPGLLLAGTNTLAVHALNSSKGDNDFLIQPELAGMRFNTFSNYFFQVSTPGAANGQGFVGITADTKFSVDRGFYEQPFSVTITSATASATIYYTTNGSIPSSVNGFIYTAPIRIEGTTLLRASAQLANYIPSIPDTHSYIFLDQVIKQPSTQSGFPTNWQASYPADYGMDPNVVNHPKYAGTIKQDLLSIPSVSIVTDHNSLWNTSTGIYVNSVSAGEVWERSASVELINPDNKTEFQINCGIRMQGNASRDNVRTPKHSIRLLFKSGHGPAKLRYPWFGDSAVKEFDNIILRAGFTDSWSTRYSDQTLITGGKGTRYRPEDSIYIRDTWMKDSQLSMGHLSARSRFVHLYVNGLYWGLYNPCERVDSSYCAQYMGGLETDWDVLAGDVAYDNAAVKDGSKSDWSQMMTIVNAGITNEAAYQKVAELVDIESLTDFMMLHIFAEAEDWPSHNWYVLHRRASLVTGLPATKWIFLVWDQEIVLDRLSRRNQVNVSNNDTPARIYSQLKAWPEYRRYFGDRLQKHLFNNGALTPSNNVARLMARAREIDRAIVGESARWGDAREFTIGANPGHGQTFTRDEWWVPELDKLCTNLLQTLNSTSITRFRSAGLYPNIEAPVLDQLSGAVPAGYNCVITQKNTGGVVYYTLDGTDPRMYGSGNVNPSAQRYESPFPINRPTVVQVRVQTAGEWSSLVDAVFYPPQDMSSLALTEIMYHPAPLGTNDADTYEFIEIKNTGTNHLDLSGLAFTNGISYVFSNGTVILPGNFIVLVQNGEAFAAKYPGVPFHGVYTGKLNNAGERITLVHPLGATIFSLAYADSAPWPITPDGWGYSLVPSGSQPSPAPDQGSKWRASSSPGGSPGQEDPSPTTPSIVINEVLSASTSPAVDAVELRNLENTNVNIGGWFLTDDPAVPMKYRLPNGTIISAGGYVVVSESQFNAIPNDPAGFALSSSGDRIYLFSGDADTNLTGYSHGFTFEASEPGVTFGRHINSIGIEQFPAQITPTLGAVNAGPRVGPVVINEIMYHPTTHMDEYIELVNISTNTVYLFDTANPTNTWRLGGLGFSFPTNTFIEPLEWVILCGIQPDAFRQKYRIPSTVPVIGPYSGQLQDSGERLSLEKPALPATNGVFYISVDEVRYNDKAPWPPSTDGSGASLQRIQSNEYGNDPINWIGAYPTPGLQNFKDADGDGMPDTWEISHNLNPDSKEDGTLDTDGDGLSNYQEYLIGTNPADERSVLKAMLSLDNTRKPSLEFSAAENVTYTVLTTTNLSENMWQSVARFSPSNAAYQIRFELPPVNLNLMFIRIKAER